MTGAEHYRQAEKLLANADHADLGGDEERYYLAVAQVHATLAQAAATMAATFAVIGAGRLDPSDAAHEWDAALRPDQ